MWNTCDIIFLRESSQLSSSSLNVLSDDLHKVFFDIRAFWGGEYFVVYSTEVACWMQTGERQSARIRTKYLRAMLAQDIAFFDKDASTGEIVSRISNDTLVVQEAIGEKVHVTLFSSFFWVGVHLLYGLMSGLKT